MKENDNSKKNSPPLLFFSPLPKKGRRSPGCQSRKRPRQCLRSSEISRFRDSGQAGSQGNGEAEEQRREGRACFFVFVFVGKRCRRRIFFFLLLLLLSGPLLVFLVAAPPSATSFQARDHARCWKAEEQQRERRLRRQFLQRDRRRCLARRRPSASEDEPPQRRRRQHCRGPRFSPGSKISPSGSAASTAASFSSSSSPLRPRGRRQPGGVAVLDVPGGRRGNRWRSPGARCLGGWGAGRRARHGLPSLRTPPSDGGAVPNRAGLGAPDPGLFFVLLVLLLVPCERGGRRRRKGRGRGPAWSARAFAGALRRGRQVPAAPFARREREKEPSSPSSLGPRRRRSDARRRGLRL